MTYLIEVDDTTPPKAGKPLVIMRCGTFPKGHDWTLKMTTEARLASFRDRLHYAWGLLWGEYRSVKEFTIDLNHANREPEYDLNGPFSLEAA